MRTHAESVYSYLEFVEGYFRLHDYEKSYCKEWIKLAIENNDENMLRFLIKMGILNYLGNYCPLEELDEEKTELVKILVNNGCKYGKDSRGQSFLHQSRNPEHLKFFLETGCVYEKDNNGYSPLSYHLTNGDIHLVIFFLERGYQFENIDGEFPGIPYYLEDNENEFFRKYIAKRTEIQEFSVLQKSFLKQKLLVSE